MASGGALTERRIHMEKKSFGTFLAQGAAGNAIATYVVLFGLVFYAPMSSVFVVVVLPLYLFVAGIIGALIGGFVWLAGWLFDRQPNMMTRVVIGIVLPTSIVIVFCLVYGLVVDSMLVLGSISACLAYSLPATLVAGSKFNPLRTIVFGSSQSNSNHDFASGFSFPPALMLRVGSLLGLLASVLYLACLVSGGTPGWGIRADDEAFMATTVVILYFLATAMVSFTSPRKFLAAVTGVFVNAPLVIWALDPDRYASVGTGFLAFVVWVFMYVWVLLIVGRMLSSSVKTEQRGHGTRILPLTLWEIQIRHALNRW